MRSIRARLLCGLLGSMLILQILSFVLIYTRIEDEIDDLFDGALERSALAYSSGASLLPISTPPHKFAVENPEQGIVISIWRTSPLRLEYQSAALPGLLPTLRPGFSKAVLDNRHWRLFASRSGDRVVVSAQPSKVRNVAARRITLRILLPSLIVVPIAGVMIWVAVAFGLSPLLRITAELRRRSHRDLSPIEAERIAPEILPMVGALNELMQRTGKIIIAQRDFIADAAHELLTPLTALGLQTQLLMRAQMPRREREMVGELSEGVARALHLVRQLLALARQGVDAGHQIPSALAFDGLVRTVVEIHQPLAMTRSINMEVRTTGTCEVMGCEEALKTMVSNLVDNAIKYTGLGGTVSINLHEDAGRLQLTIEDSGPGIPEEEHERVFDRFYRRGGSTAGGSGLGLAIVREIAARHDATIALGSSLSLGGLRAVILLPALAKDSALRFEPMGRLETSDAADVQGSALRAARG